jgi:hydroxymethylpyrimidine/phosphomethylpyrimidine kinase
MTHPKPYVMSIAGLDPSGGAGLLADIKTFENQGATGFGVATAITVQNDVEFESCDWVPVQRITRQIEVLLQRFPVRHFKIGLVENGASLEAILDCLWARVMEPIIVFDPILRASAGFAFHGDDGNLFADGLRRVYCVTPNIPEALHLFGTAKAEVIAQALAPTLLYLKGGHADGLETLDQYVVDGGVGEIRKPRLAHGAKHGSGCVLSAALTAALARGESFGRAAHNASAYTYALLQSNDTLLGDHSQCPRI